MKRKAAPRKVKATGRQPFLKFPTATSEDDGERTTGSISSCPTPAETQAKKQGMASIDAASEIARKKSFSANEATGMDRSILKDTTTKNPISSVLMDHRDNWIGRGQSKAPALPDTENLPSIPDHWVWVTPEHLSTAEVGAICAGPFGTIFKACDFRHEGIPIIFLRHVAPGHYLTHKPGFMDREKWKQLFQPYSVYGGELLITKLGDPPGVCAIYPKGIGPAMVTPDVIKLIPNIEAVVPTFLMHYFNCKIARDFATGVAFGTTRLRLTLPIFREMPVPLPPLPEQRRIVAEIEKQFTRLDAGVAALKRVQANLKRYRAAVLKAACEGKLVPTEAELADRGGTKFQSGAELLATISDLEANDLNPRRAGRLWGAGHVPDLTDEERLSLPDGWVWAKVRELGFDPGNAVQVGPMSMKSSDFTDAGTPVLNVGCVQWGRFVESKLDHLPAEKAAEFERYRIKCGDVLFTRSGTVGRCAVAQPHQDGWLMTFHLLRARANPEKCLPSFLRIVFEGAPHIRRQTREASVGSTRAGFNTNLLGNLAIPLPPLAEQTRIVAEVERRLSVVDELEAVVSANLQRANRLRQSILQKAFTGELTGDGTCLRDSQASVERVVSRQAAGVAVSPTPAARR